MELILLQTKAHILERLRRQKIPENASTGDTMATVVWVIAGIPHHRDFPVDLRPPLQQGWESPLLYE